ncbi:MAG TPA: hypothetical protein VD970_08000 [Acetobacteraceae bacterium]|nr:hypothetical protein [Acetobacteraceae bacterium]
MPANPKRELTELEKKFVQEAKQYAFEVLYTPDGTPYAMGAQDNSVCFSMAVEEHKERGGLSSSYFLK